MPILAATPVKNHDRHSLEELLEKEIRIARLRGYTFAYLIIHHTGENINAVRILNRKTEHLTRSIKYGIKIRYDLTIAAKSADYLTLEAQWKKEQ